MSFMRGLKRFGKGVGNMFGQVAPALGGIGGGVLGGMFGGPAGAAAGSALGGAMGQGVGGMMHFGGHGQNKGRQGNQGNFMPGQQQFGNTPMGQMGGAMGQQFGGQLGSRMSPAFQPFAQMAGQMGGQYLQNKMNQYMPESMQNTNYGNVGQSMMNQGMAHVQNRYGQQPQQQQQQGPQFGPQTHQEHQNQQAFAEMPFAGEYAEGGHVDGYADGGMASPMMNPIHAAMTRMRSRMGQIDHMAHGGMVDGYHGAGYMPHHATHMHGGYPYAEGGAVGLRELADMIAQATGGQQGGGMGGAEGGQQAPSY